MTKPIYLHGGGDHPNGRATTLGRFVQATRAKGSVRIALIVVEPTEEDASKSAQAYCRIFEAIGGATNRASPCFGVPYKSPYVSAACTNCSYRTLCLWRHNASLS
ncbi:hypothetical protein KFU94_26490 [Chloroflexi bacterium TSY]|nr:hypothetical protein [Chloroflexi bacterium TSY]